MERMTTIYALIDPRDGAVRYIGKANDPYFRLNFHVKDKRCTAPRRVWFKELNSLGIMPLVAILECVPMSEWQSAERSWIAFYRSIGANLLNYRDGGNGQPWIDEETRQKLRARFLGRPKTPEHVAKLPQNQKGYKQSSARAERSRAALAKAMEVVKGGRKKPEHVAKLPQNQPGYGQGRRHSQETRAKISVAAVKREAAKRLATSPDEWARRLFSMALSTRRK